MKEPEDQPPPHKAAPLWSQVRDWAWIIIPLVLAVFFAAVYFYRFVNPAPPRSITLATGSPEQTYYQVGTELSEALREQNLEVKILPTNGSIENLQLLSDPDSRVTLAFVQSGSEAAAPEVNTDDLVSLGSCFYEPLWLFYRRDLSIERLTDLRGLRVSAGPVGSGTRAVVLPLLADNGVVPENWRELALPTAQYPVHALEEGSGEKLLAGELDAVFYITSVQSPVVRELLANPEIALYEPPRAKAYATLYPFLSARELPEGVLDLQANVPAEDKSLLATSAMLVSRKDLHPAITALLLKELKGILGEPSILEKRGEFPSPDLTSLPVGEDAARFYEHGPPFLQRFMPFWAAALIDRFIFMALPLVTLMIPLFRLAGPAYRWRIRSRIYRWYRDLRDIDEKLRDDTPRKNLRTELTRLDELAGELAKVDVPLSYADALYDLRLHVDLLRRRLQDLMADHSAPPGGEGEDGGTSESGN